MKEPKENDKDVRITDTEKPTVDELDTAGKSLSEALRMSFIILKVIMIVLVLAFLASGFETVDSNEQALVLRFGKIRGVGEKRILGPGLHWILPYPIDEIVKIPVERAIHLSIDSFWYHESPQERISGAISQSCKAKVTAEPESELYGPSVNRPAPQKGGAGRFCIDVAQYG